MNQQQLKLFQSESIGFQIISIFYDKNQPIEFDIDKVHTVLGHPKSSIRRVLSELYYANCITKKGYHHSTTYIITPRNAWFFSNSVANTRTELCKLRTSKKKNKRINELSSTRSQKGKSGSDVRTPVFKHQCVVCKKFFTFKSLQFHRRYCKVKQFSFVRN